MLRADKPRLFFEYAVRLRGIADARVGRSNSSARITTSAIYNFNTGRIRYGTDANGRQSETTYFTQSLRPQTLILATLGYTSYSYDDTAMTVTETVKTPASGTVASQNVKLLNGLGQVKREDALGQNSEWDYVDTKYDVMGRVWQQSRPHRSGETQQWSVTSYDA